MEFYRIRLTTDDLTVIDVEDATWPIKSDQHDLDDQSTLITGLQPGTRYFIQVRAVYSTSSQGGFESADLTTGPFVLRNATGVTGFQATDVRKQQVDLVWNDPGWIPRQQFIQVRVGNGQWERPEGGGVQVERQFNTISSLRPQTTYQIRHVLVSEGVDGQLVETPSDPIVVTTDAYPAVPGFYINQVSSDAATAHWSSLTEGGPTHYRVRVYRNGTTNDVVFPLLVGSSVRSARMHGLNPSTTYQMEVEALKNGTWISSTGRQSFTTTSVPTGPENVRLQATKWRSLSVSWTDPNWNATDHLIELFTTNGQRVMTATASGNANSKELTGLTVGTTYYAIVTARGTEGNIPSARSANTSTYGLTAPTGFEVDQVGTEMQFQWNHFKPLGMPTSFHYDIQRKGGDGLWKQVNNNPISGSSGSTAQSFSIQRSNSKNPLQKGKTYQFRVVVRYANNDIVSSEIPFLVS